MANQEEVNNQRQLNQETERTLSLEQELISILARRAGVDSTTLNNQQDIGNVLSDQLKNLKFQVQEKRLIRNITTKINNLARDSYSIGAESLGTDKSRVKFQQDILNLEENIRLLEIQRIKFSQQEDELSQNIAASLKMQVEEAQDLRNELKSVESLSEKISDNFGVKTFGALSEITQKIPGLSKFSTPFKEAEEATRKTSLANIRANEIKKLGNKISRDDIKRLGLQNTLISKNGKTLAGGAAYSKALSLGLTKQSSVLITGAKALGPLLKKALGPIGLIIELVQGIMQADKETVELQKSMALTRWEAMGFRTELALAAASSGDINITSTKLLETFSSLNKQFGFITNFATDTLVTMTKLTKVVGIGAESAGNLAAASALTGGSFEDNYKDVLGTSYELQRQSGVQMDLRDILEQTGKVTGTVRANLGANPALISKAVTQAKLFGASLEDVANAGKALLNFESSIEAELQAELLLGRNINLERARAAALAGDQVTLAQELQQQAGSFSEFTSMNVIQQEALAKAMGMQSDQLADILFQQEIQGKTARELRAAGKEELAQRLEAQTLADKFNATVDKLKEIFTNVGTAFMPVLQILGAALSIVGAIVGLIGDVINFFKGDLTSENSGFMKGMKGAGSSLADAFNFSTADDLEIPAGYGETIVKKGKDVIALNNNDSFIAGTNLGGNNESNNESKRTNLGGNNELLGESKRTNQLLKMLVKQNDKKPEISPVGLYQVQ